MAINKEIADTAKFDLEHNIPNDEPWETDLHSEIEKLPDGYSVYRDRNVLGNLRYFVNHNKSTSEYHIKMKYYTLSKTISYAIQSYYRYINLENNQE